MAESNGASVHLAGTAMRLVDLSLPLANHPGRPPAIVYHDHRETAVERAGEYGFSVEDLPVPGVHMAHESFLVGTHAGGTHIDAPWHYGPVCGGEPAPSIDEVPLSWFVGAGIVVDCRDVPAGHTIDLADFQQRVRSSGPDPHPGEVVLVNTGASRRWGQADYEQVSPGLSAAVMDWLLDRGVRVVGTDAFSIDPQVEPMAQALREGDKAAYFPAHMTGRQRPVCIIEKLANLAAIPARGFTVIAFPVLVERGSGGWCRAVALVPEPGANP